MTEGLPTLRQAHSLTHYPRPVLLAAKLASSTGRPAFSQPAGLRHHLAEICRAQPHESSGNR
jgi:hypothetical protein